MRGCATVATAVGGVLLVGGCSLGAEPFEPAGAEASAGRERARTLTGDLLARASVDLPVLASTVLDGCVTGQSNWKRRDSFAHACSLVDSRVVVLAADEEDVAATLTAYDDVLEGAGCRPREGGGLDGIREEYWSPGNPEVAARGAAGLPSATYDCEEGVVLTVQPTSAREDERDPRTALGPPAPGDQVLAGRPHDEAALAALRDSGAALAAVVSATRGYYRTTF